MNRRTIIVVATMLATIVAVIPIIFATILSYRHARNVEVKNLSETVLTIKHNIEYILNDINHTIPQISRLNPNCNAATVATLRKLDFLHPQISSFFIANLKEKTICTSLGILAIPTSVKVLHQSNHMQLIGPLTVPLIDKPILMIYKSGRQQMIYGAMLLPKVFISGSTKSLETHGFIGIIDLVKNHVYVASGKNLEFEPTQYFSTDVFSYVNYKVTLNGFPVPVTLAVKLNNLGHTFVVGADIDEGIGPGLWWNILIAMMFGLLVSSALIAFVLYMTQKHLSLERELARAITRQEFEVYYQPVIDLNQNICVGAEALIRWKHKENGIILPDQFIPLAEQNGQIIEITQWLIQQAVEDLSHIMQQYPDFHLAINLSAKFFQNDDIVQILNQACTKNKINPQQFIVELTERELIKEDNEFAIKLMHQLRALHISLALDDFGTGYSSLSYLRLFPFDYLKIDRQFIAAIGTGAITEDLVINIIDIANKLNLTIIAEGLETKEQIEYIKRNNITLIQGWYYSKPLPLNEFLKYLEEHSS